MMELLPGTKTIVPRTKSSRGENNPLRLFPPFLCKILPSVPDMSRLQYLPRGIGPFTTCPLQIMGHSRLLEYKTSHQPDSYFPVLSRPRLPLPSDHPGVEPPSSSSRRVCAGPDLRIAVSSPRRA
jgi:hypothetical protein